MEILAAVAAKIAELIVEPIVKQGGYLLCNRNNLRELQDVANELQATKEPIDHKVEAERRNRREIYGNVLKWQESVITTLEEAKQLCEDPHGANAWCFPNLKSRYQRGRKAKKMAGTIVEMKLKGEEFDEVGYVPPLDITSNLPAIRGSDGLESRKSVREHVVLSLKDPKVNKIGVYGLGGVGKTTLVQEIAKQVKHDKLFDVVVLVTISQTKLERIQDEIAQQLGLDFEGRTLSSVRANHLCERIKNEDAILIILDNLQEKIDLDELGIPSLDAWGKMNPENVGVPLKDDYKGCKLLLTSRSKDILQKNHAQKNFLLDVLNGEEPWSLFEAMVGDVVKDDNFRKIAIQVAQRCVGLPVLIVTIAKSLNYNKNIHYWKDTLNNLKRVDSGDMKETISSALEFNFNRLEDEVKKVFLLCGVHGRSIHVSDLLKYAIGLGIFKCINTIEDARNRLYRIIIDLKASCLLVDDDARAEIIKMHDIVHEVAVSMASEYAFTKIDAKLQDWPRKDIFERCTHIILDRCCIQKLSERLDCPHLTFLYINSSDNHTLEIPNSFFEGMGNLEALDLTGMSIASLPISLRSLTKLKTLCLDHCSLKDMTGIGALMNLEILSLIGSSMEEFPREIKQLTKLRMLDLSRSGIGTTLPNILCQLTKIEELYMGCAKINWELECSAMPKRNASLAKLGDLTGLTTLEIQIREAWLLPKDIAFEKLERYKAVIGDKWEWSDNKETSRLLKVKLDTSIHSEQGIKTLIKRVEDLNLDEISGISNVLFELNGEGFPLLRHLHIQNNGEIQHIVNLMKGKQTHVLFPKLETMILHNLNNLVEICQSSVRDNSFGKLKVVKVTSCDQLVYLFSVSMVKAFSQLVEIEVSECSSMKKIMSVESIDSGKTFDEEIEFLPLRSLTLQHLPTIDYFCSHELTSSLGTTDQNLLRVNISTPFFSAEVKFSNLETLKLSSLNLKKIWDESSAPYLVHNLANLTVEDCIGLKYIFSSSMVGRLSNLKQLEISKCDMMEEIIAIEEINSMAVGEVLFPKLEAIIIKDMQNLKTIWPFILASSSLACLKTLKVKNCEQIEKIFPEYMNGAFATLETLNVEDCKSVQEIFQLGDNADDKPKLKYITLLRLPQLKQVWSRDPQSSHCFKSLQFVLVEGCGRLEYLFPFSIAEHLPQLEAITIKNAEKMKEIVSKREGPLYNVVNFEFDQLTSIVLWNLQDLQGFYAGSHSLSCSSLKELNVWKCGKLKLFKTQGMSSHGRQHSLFTLEEVINNLENLDLSSEDARMIFQSRIPRDQFRQLKFLRLHEFDAQATSPYWFLQNISNLEWLVIQDMSFIVIFPDERPQDENGEIEIKTRLKKLTLCRLYELQHICKEGCQLDPVLEVLEHLYVLQCSSLKHLVHSSITFNHLTRLEVQNCNGLIYLITSSTARSLVNLRTFKIIKCHLVEQIVEEVEGESICEIAFRSLKVLELQSLPKLKMFCSSSICYLKLPVLEKLVIRQCARMESFSVSDTSTPLLREILTDEQDKKWFCEGHLNNTVNKMFQDKVAFHSAKLLELSEYPELKDLWSSYVQLGIFGNLTNLVVHKCDFLSYVLLPLNLLQALSNLEGLKVSECDSLRAVFDLSNINERGMSEKIEDCSSVQEVFQLGVNGRHNGDDTTRLKNLTLLRLPKLKQIWSKDSQSSLRFKSLQVVHVEGCEDLEHLFPLSIAKHLPQLEEIMLVDLENMKEIVSNREETIDDPVKFEFDQLTSLVLSNIQDLRGFFSGNHSLSCSSLKILDVYYCEKLKLFKTPATCGQERLSDDNLHDTMQQPLFTLEEVIENLESLCLNNEDASMIFQSQVPRDRIRKLNFLRLYGLEDAKATSPYYFLQNISSLEELVIQEHYFKVIFPDERPRDKNGEIEINTRLKKLTLYKLYELEHLCKEECQLDPVLDLLELLDVDECSNLKHLVPSSVTFNHLICLEVQNCNGLIYLITSSTARSLVNLTTLKIIKCDLVEQIVEEVGGESNCEIAFQSLKLLELKSLPKLKMFCSGSICYFKLPVLEKLVIRQCARMESFSTSDTSTPLLQEILTDEQDKKWFCEGHLNNTMNKMFQDKVAFRSAKLLELSEYPELKDLWSSYVQLGIFGNLTNLVVHKCDFLSYVLLPLNLLQALSNLKGLKVSECDSLRAVFDLTNMNERGMSTKVIIHLKTIELSRLPELKHIWKINSQEKEDDDEEEEEDDGGDIQHGQSTSFHQVYLPNLETYTIEDMENLDTIWPPVLTPNSMGRFQTLKVKSCQKIEHIFPIYMHGAFAPLETLMVENCNSVQEVFQLGVNGSNNGDDTTRLKNLTLLRLPKLKQIWSKEPQSSLRFKNLQVVRVEGCEALEHLFPSSIAKHLPQLEAITLKDLENMKGIVSNREETVDDPVKFEFDQLTLMVLWNLQELREFFAGNHSLSCSSLKELDVRNCEKLKLFKTHGTFSQERLFDDNLRVTMRQPLFTLQEVEFSDFNHLEFSKYPELKQLWYGQNGQKIFRNLKHLVVHKCTFLSNMIFSSNFLQLLYTLEELEVAGCESLEAIFDVKALNDKAMESKGVSRLKKLTLSGLPNLKQIWNKEAGEIISFENLQIVKVDECPNLKYVFSPSVCQELRQLEELNIESCGVENIVANEEGFKEFKFDFPLLRIFRLICLMQVNDFYPKRYTLECPSLKVLNVYKCEALQIFTFGQMDSQQHRGVCVNLPIQRALFHIEKVSENLEELSLNEKDARRILNGNYEKKLFQRMKILRLQNFQAPTKFLNDLIQKFPATTTLQMRSSSFETLFILKEFGHCSVGNTTQIKKLWLYLLEQLEHIWNDDGSASHPLVQNLEELWMWECSRIIRLAPPSACFKNLTFLGVKDCNGLMYFMTTCTAKSLIHLTDLIVRNCGKLEEVVVTNDEGQSKEEITFESLKYLELNCLSRFKSFYSGKHSTFIFPSLVTLQVIGCPQMQNFSSGVIIAPFLKLVEVENGKKQWKEDLNTTIKQLFIDKVKGEGIEGDCKESSSINIENNLTHQKRSSTTRALRSDELKACEIVNSGEQVMHKLSTPHTGICTQKICEITETLDQASQNTLKFTKVDAVIETRGMHETTEGDSVQDAQNKLSFTIVQDAATIYQSLSQAPELDTAQNTEESNNSYIETQEMWDSVKKPSSPTAQNARNSAMILDSEAIDQSPSQAPEPMTSSILESSAYSDKWLIDISKQNSYLEAGLKRHPKVLDWFSTKRRRAFTALFTEVTCILRTTRRCDLTEDDRNYIRECCTALEAVDFDASWLSYVYGCIESCGDGNELMRKLEETEAKASTLRDELASVEASLVSLRDEASRLHNFIEE